ncbi:FecR family protein [Methylosinus sporium]|uniref:FecR family protein n=1 Tax=Methylosinus sporium TaxID=428 RepID=UPI00383A6130
MNESNGNSRGEDPRDAAIEWWLRRKNRAPTSCEQTEFEAWLAADTANRAAFDDISDMCGHLIDMDPARSKGLAGVRTGRSWRLPAAALVAASVAFAVFFDDLSLFLRSDYRAGTGETKRITLEDGSRVELDSRSAIAVRYSAGERRLALLAGEAWFEVAPDRSRPFVVEAAGGSTTALGTAFDVAVADAQARVTVTQHRVSVASGGRKVIVDEGQQSAYATNGAAQPAEPANVERATAWRRGRLMFEDRPLGEVIEALGRYHHGFVYFPNPALRARRVTGIFGADDPLSALEEVEASLGLHAVNLTNYLILIYE